MLSHQVTTARSTLGVMSHYVALRLYTEGNAKQSKAGKKRIKMETTN